MIRTKEHLRLKEACDKFISDENIEKDVQRFLETGEMCECKNPYEKILFLYISGYPYAGAVEKIELSPAQRKRTKKLKYVLEKCPELNKKHNQAQITVLSVIQKYLRRGSATFVREYFAIPSTTLQRIKKGLFYKEGLRIDTETWEKYLQLYRAIITKKIRRIELQNKNRKRNRKTAWTKENLKNVLELFWETGSWEYIAQHYGVMYHTIYEYVFLKKLHKYKKAAEKELQQLFSEWRQQLFELTKQKSTEELSDLFLLPWSNLYAIMTEKQPKTFTKTTLKYIKGFRNYLIRTKKLEEYAKKYPLLIGQKIPEELL